MKRGKHSTFNIQHSTPKESQATVLELNEGAGRNRKFDLEDRLLEFASAIIDLSESLPATRAGNHIAGQVLRSGTSAYPNHGEAEAAESRDDFVHKLKICLKELRETRRWARLIKRKAWVANETTLVFVLGECEELVRIFHSSIQTAKRNAQAEARKPSRPGDYPPGVSG
jgi:four helix bundle protein